MWFVLFSISIAAAIAGEYTTYIGDAYPRTVSTITTDSAGNTYIVGNREAPVVLTALITAVPIKPLPSFPETPAPPADVFVSKVDPTGKVLFTDAFAGKGVDRGLAGAVDPTGNIYVGGTTTSIDFPVSNALQAQPGQFGEGFIVKISPDGKTILYSTYFGGVDGPTTINAMTTDASGNLYVTGTTLAYDFPHTVGMPYYQATTFNSFLGSPVQTAFITAISAAGDKILFSGSVGGSTWTCTEVQTCASLTVSTTGVAIALDAVRNVYFGGNTNVTDLPATSGAFQGTGGIGAFAGKINANGSGLAYLTYVGIASELAHGPALSGANVLSSLTVDSAGNAYLGGTTGDPKFPVTTGSFQQNFAGGPVNEFNVPANTDGFLAKLKPDGSAFVWATYLGGNGNDVINSIAVDTAGDVWACGTTASTNFPNAQGWSQGGDFLVEINSAGAALPFSGRYPTGTISQAVGLDAATFVHASGATGIVSSIASTTSPSMKVFGVANAAGGSLAGRVSFSEVITIYGPHIGPATPATPAAPVSAYPTTLSGVQVMIDGVPAPLLYVSDGQINAVVPMEVTYQASTIQIFNGSAITPLYPLWIDAFDSAVFPGVLNPDGSLNSEANPAKLGSVVSLYATGWQPNFAPLTDGQVATQANNVCGQLTCLANEGTIVYAGSAPGIVEGVTQFNLLLNATGPQAVSLTGLQQVYILVSNLAALLPIWIKS